MKKVLLWCLFFCLFLCGVTKAAELPGCGDKSVINEVTEEVKRVNTRDGILSPLKLRKIRLLKKYLVDFEEIPVDEFLPRKEYAVSDTILELKINKNYKDEDFRICKSKSNVFINPIYVLLYRDKENNEELVFKVINVEGI